MSDITELAFADEHVGPWLADLFGAENIEQEVYLDNSGRYADFWVDLGQFAIAVEVENDWEASVKGVGQAMLYAKHEQNVWPLVVVPKGHIEQPEFDYLRERSPVAIVEVDY